MIKLSDLEAARKAMTSVAQYKATTSWNNTGCPLADFAIPGHNGGATVEMLAGDAFGIVATHNAADKLIAIAKAALAVQHSRNPEEDLAARRALIAALAEVEP